MIIPKTDIIFPNLNIAYNTLEDAYDGGNFPAGGDYSAFSFTAGYTGTLNGLTLDLEDADGSTDGGSLTVALYSSDDSSYYPTPDRLIATLGTISDTSLSGSLANVDVPLPSNINLTAGTRYWIDITGSSTSEAGIGFENSDAGTGASGQYIQEGGTNQGFPDASVERGGDGANIAEVTESAGGTQIAYDTLGQTAVDPPDASVSGTFTAFSIQPTSSGTVYLVNLDALDPDAATDHGYVTVALYTDAGGKPGTEVATIGTISDVSMGTTSPNEVGVMALSVVPLQANTTYWIEVTGSGTSNAEIASGPGGGGVGATGSVEYNDLYDVYNDPTTSGYHSSADSSDAVLAEVVEEVPCFCRGTRILTPHGEVPVEQLRIGDEVTTLSGQTRPLTWVGSGRSLVTPANPNARRIIVSQGALADGVPSRDLYLTRGHSLLLDSMLIPVEFLINDRSIAWDETARVVEFYHLELERHDILLADGAQAESYREDGNRHLFHNADAPLHARPDMPAYAPVLTGGPAVDAVWARLAARAGGGVAELTDDADLHLMADGVRIDGAADGTVHRFRLDRAPFELRIRSRVCNPTRLGTVRDPRDLGVALRRLVLRADGAALVLGYDSPWLAEGFNGAESSEAIRWTTGDAVVPGRVLAAFDGPVEVELDLGMTTRYARPADEMEQRRPGGSPRI